MTRSTREMLADQISAQANQFDEIFAAEDPADELHEAPLEISVRRSLVVVLCTGGPHVEVVADLDEDGIVTDARLDGWWGQEHESRRVARQSALWRALEGYTAVVAVE